MTDLNLDFDVDTKNIALTNGLNDNLSINQESDKSFFSDANTSNTPNTPNTPTFTEPKLSVSSDISGVELLAKGVSTEKKTDGYSSGQESDKDEGFSFFKKIDEKGGLVDDNEKEPNPQVEDEIFLQQENRADSMSDYKPIHKLYANIIITTQIKSPSFISCLPSSTMSCESGEYFFPSLDLPGRRTPSPWSRCGTSNK